jgi:hypothetical protein
MDAREAGSHEEILPFLVCNEIDRSRELVPAILSADVFVKLQRLQFFFSCRNSGYPPIINDWLTDVV